MTVDMELAIQDVAPRLLRYCKARAGNAELAEEIAQETLVALITRWRRYGPPLSVNGFVFSIARRKAARAIARRRLFVPLGFLFARSNNHNNPEAAMLNKYREKQVLDTIRRIPAHERKRFFW